MEDLLAVAIDTAREAGDLLLERFAAPRTGVTVKSSATDMVSDADRAAEALILTRLTDRRPGDAVLGEEGSQRSGTTGLRWVVDPLDGTSNFLFGLPHFAVSLACEDAAGALVGVVHDPSRAETFAARRDGGASCNGRPIRVSAAASLEGALVATGFSYRPEERAVQARMLTRILPAVRDIRRAGAASLDLAWTAAGRFDGFYEAPLQRWDWLAGALLVREAGGEIADLGPVGSSGPGLTAAGPGLFRPLARLVEDARFAALSPDDPAGLS